ncbi:MAG: tetratricopeptide repeat protein [Raineya sp.]|nr:tetratricopeptide repeat protein [Raineya sp.]
MEKSCIRKILYFIFLITLVSSPTMAQDLQLAEEYFVQGKYEKAKDIYDKLARNSSNWRSIHQSYLLTLVNLKDYKTAEEFVKKQVKNDPNNLPYKIDYGVILEMQTKIKEAEKEFDNVISLAKKDKEKTLVAHASFEKYDKYEWSEKLFLEARRHEGSSDKYSLQLGDIYAKMGKKMPMIEEFVKLYNKDEDNAEYVKGVLQDEIRTDEEIDKLEQYLLGIVQENPNHTAGNELLLWLYMQQKNFNKAFLQAKAIDKRFKKQGSQLFDIGRIAFENRDYPATEKILGYFVEQYPNSEIYYIPARRYLIRSKEEVIKNTYPIDKEKVKTIIKDYQDLVNSQGKSRAVEAIKDMALLYAFYLDDKEKALSLLNEAIEEAKYNVKFSALCKIALGDIYVLMGDYGEASLLYYQAEKAQKDSPIAYEAKLKNAKLSYYKGDFELAQTHLDILKNATSREISNDAIDLSVFIQDNTGMDSTEAAMKEYARIDLLVFQNKTDEALADLDKMLKTYNGHSLTDNIYWAKAGIYIKMGKSEKAVEMYELILKDYKFDILSDDAHFNLAKTYEERLNNKEKAMNLYQEHLTQYPGSVYVAEARKRFRLLRGDKLK